MSIKMVSETAENLVSFIEHYFPDVFKDHIAILFILLRAHPVKLEYSHLDGPEAFLKLFDRYKSGNIIINTFEEYYEVIVLKEEELLRKPIVIELSPKDIDMLKTAFANYSNQIEIIDTQRLEGGDLVCALIYLSSITVPLVAKIIIELIKSRKHVSIKIDGAEISGLSERNALELLTQLLESSKNKHEDTEVG